MRSTATSEPPVRADGLAPVEIGDADAFLAAYELSPARSAIQFFPRLYFYGQGQTHTLRWEHHGNSILLYQIRKRPDGWRMSLYLPPIPFADAALKIALERVADFNGDRRGRIVWVPEGEALTVAHAGLSVRFLEDEYIFDKGAVLARNGGDFRSSAEGFGAGQQARERRDSVVPQGGSGSLRRTGRSVAHTGGGRRLADKRLFHGDGVSRKCRPVQSSAPAWNGRGSGWLRSWVRLFRPSGGGNGLQFPWDHRHQLSRPLAAPGLPTDGRVSGSGHLQRLDRQRAPRPAGREEPLPTHPYAWRFQCKTDS